MRHKTLRVGLVVVSLFVLLAIVFAASRPAPPPPAPRFARLGPQHEPTEQEARELLKPVEPQRDPSVTLPEAFGTIESLKDVPPVPHQPSAVLSRAEEPELPRLYPEVDRGPDAVAQLKAGTINMPSPI